MRRLLVCSLKGVSRWDSGVKAHSASLFCSSCRGWRVGDERSAYASPEGEQLYDAEELRFLELINHYRHNNGLEPLLLSDTITLAAEHHSQDMANYSFFGHTTASSSHYMVGSQPWDRMRSEGYDYNTLMGENIAVGCEGADRCFELWRNSPSHNAAMLDGSYRVMGIGRVYVEGSVHGWYWTTDFGAKVDPTSHAAAGGESTSVQDGPGIENGGMITRAVWEQEATDDAQLILSKGEGVEGGYYARLGDYDNGRDELSQKVRVDENGSGEELLSYRIKIETNEHHHPQQQKKHQQQAAEPSDYLKVRLTDGEGEQLEVLKKYTDWDAGGEGWRRQRVDLSGYEGRTVYVSFEVKTDELHTTAFYLDGVALEDRGE
jgi:uncharacterized protein YkwD